MADRVIGNKRNIGHLSEAEKRGKLSHAYIINGPEGSGKKTLAKFLSEALLCEEMRGDADDGQANLFSMMGMAPPVREIKDGPCGNCHSCIRSSTGNHPDIIWVTHEKATVLSVKEIRQQVVNDVAVKPYYGPYKIYIIADAQLMNDNGQNALLKTIEEPPEYVIIFLLTDNADGLLDTIRSRCVRLDMEVFSAGAIAEELEKRGKAKGEEARAAGSFAAGNLGMALKIAGEEDEREFIDNTVSLLKTLKNKSSVEIFEAASLVRKEDTGDFLKIVRMWFRDVLLIKSEAADEAELFFPKERKTLSEQAGNISFENINNILNAVETARERIEFSVKAEAAIECLLLTARRGQKG